MGESFGCFCGEGGRSSRCDFVAASRRRGLSQFGKSHGNDGSSDWTNVRRIISKRDDSDILYRFLRSQHEDVLNSSLSPKDQELLAGMIKRYPVDAELDDLLDAMQRTREMNGGHVVPYYGWFLKRLRDIMASVPSIVLIPSGNNNDNTKTITRYSFILGNESRSLERAINVNKLKRLREVLNKISLFTVEAKDELTYALHSFRTAHLSHSLLVLHRRFPLTNTRDPISKSAKTRTSFFPSSRSPARDSVRTSIVDSSSAARSFAGKTAAFVRRRASSNYTSATRD